MIPRPGNLYKIVCDHRDTIKGLITNYKRMAGASAEESHAAAVVAHQFFRLTDKQWNSPSGAEYFAAVYACILFHKLY
jgi:hypothetical protein